jgi:anaerobic C4-dicarboxylate transporter DcuA
MFFTVAAIILLLSIFLGARIGGLGIAYAAGIGLFIFTMVMGIAPGNIPTDVVFIIISVIGLIAVMELSGGLDYLVYLAEKLLRANPKSINYLAPLVTFFMTVFAGTGHTAFSLMPVIVEVAKNQGIRPSRPLTLAAVMSQIGIIASPISAAVVAFVGFLAGMNISLIQLLAIMIPSAVLSSLIASFVVGFFPQKLETDANYQALLKAGKITDKKLEEKVISKKAPLAVLIFLLTVLAVMVYGMFPELKPVYTKADGSTFIISTAQLIMILMLLGAYIMVILTKVDITKIATQSTFKAGMQAALCVLGVAWLGDTLVSYYSGDIKAIAGDFLHANGWALAVVLFFASSLLYSQAAATTALMLPLGIALGLSPHIMIGSFAAVCGLFLLPTYPTVIAAVQMDYTGTTRFGKYVFDHSFILPGTLLLVLTCVIAYFLSYIVI